MLRGATGQVKAQFVFQRLWSILSGDGCGQFHKSSQAVACRDFPVASDSSAYERAVEIHPEGRLCTFAQRCLLNADASGGAVVDEKGVGVGRLPGNDRVECHGVTAELQAQIGRYAKIFLAPTRGEEDGT